MKSAWRRAAAIPGTIMLLAMGCNLFAGIERGTPRAEDWCADVSDCVVEVPQCRSVVACSSGRCVYEDVPADDPLGEQSQRPGDCATLVCDGAGGKRLLPNESDPPDDGDPCTEDLCEATRGHHVPRDLLYCYTGPAGTKDVGKCRSGLQYCSGGKPVGGCQLEIVPSKEWCDEGKEDEDCDGQVNEEGKHCVCVPGVLYPCYSGPPATKGVGACIPGQQECDDDGLGYGPCNGEVIPAAETCDYAMEDEDCDGAVNEEGADCVCGDGFVSAAIGEDCDDGNDSSDDACNELCKLAVCGDGLLGHGETCDDGNTSDGDACPASCLRPVAHLTAGTLFGCAALLDGRIKCWGSNQYGQLGLGDTIARGDEPGEIGDSLPPVDLGMGTPDAVSAGASHACALFSGGALKCWGNNEYGQLGLGDTDHRGDGPGEMGDALAWVDLGTGAKAVAVSLGSVHTCALMEDGSVKCWGRNHFGQLGLGNKIPRGVDPDQMGDVLPAVNLGTGKKVMSIAAGSYHTCALLEGGAVKCWGYNQSGQLGLGDLKHRGDGPGEMGDALPAVDLGLGQQAVAITAGACHTCALLASGRMKCWGCNSAGALGLGLGVESAALGDGPGEMGSALPAVDLGAGKKAVAIAAGGSHACALLAGGGIKCWGANDDGQLGLGHVSDKGQSPSDMGDDLPFIDLGAGKVVTSVTCGFDHSCALLKDGRAKCWGRNVGQLGLGDVENRGDSPGEMGDALPAVAP